MTGPFIERVVNCLLPGDSTLRLADVGASGGIAAKWSVFGDRLQAVGFDPLVAEITRLRAVDTRPNVRYEAAFVGWEPLERCLPAAERDRLAARSLQPFERSSAVAAHRIRRLDYTREVFNAGAPVEYANRLVVLDEYFDGQPPPDFIKVDTDGSDYPVLLGAQRLLESGVLGIEVEVQFHGAVHEYANTFANIDRYLRAKGFSLFDLTPYRYSRAALPGPFVYDLAAQTRNGQVVWGEAVYFRDLAHPGYDATFRYRTTRESALKLCCLFVLFGLADCAAELLATHPSLASLPERAELLDLLTPTTLGRLSYDDYLASFADDPTRLFPTRLAESPATALPAESLRHVPGATGLGFVSTHAHWDGAAAVHDDGGVTITTPAPPWSYAAEIGVDRSCLGSGGPFCLRMEVRVERGRIGVGVLDAEGRAFTVEREFADGQGPVTADLVIPSFDDVQHVIVRNTSTDGSSSQATFRSIELYVLPAVAA